MKSWNKGQAEGIHATGANVLLNASAGTGKTAVLVERLIRRLTDPVNPLAMDRFIFVTFTNAAAQEMIRRVRRGIEDRARDDPGNRFLARQRQLLGQAAISTLHSFCLDLIRRHYKEIGIDPQSRVLSEPEQVLLQGETLDIYLDECYEANEPGFAALTAVYGGERSDEAFKQMVLRIYAFAVTQPRPLVWLRNSVNIYQKGNGVEKLLPLLKELVTERLAALARSLDKGAALASSLPMLAKYEYCLKADRKKIRDLANINDWDDFVKAIGQAKSFFDRLPAIPQKISGNETPEAYETRLSAQTRVKEIRAGYKKDFFDLTSALAGGSRQYLEEEIAAMAPAMIALASLAASFYRRYEIAKREKAVIDFGDIEHYAAALLFDDNGKVTDLAKTLQGRYEEIMVDEYQDINPVQDAILQALRGERLLMAGDVKQSIYGFRQAAPEIFLDKYRRFKDNRDGSLVTLEESYRSSQWVVAGINQVFDHCMTGKASGVDYQREGRFSAAVPLPEEAAPVYDPAQGQGALELHLIDLSLASQTDFEPEEAGRAPKGFAGYAAAGSGTGQDSNTSGPTGAGVWPGVSGSEPGESGAEPEIDGDEQEAGSDSAGQAGTGQGADGAGDTAADERETLPDPDVLQAEAAFCGDRILRMASEGLWDREQGRFRPLRYRDIAILLPALKGVADAFVEGLQARNIPVYADVGGGYFQAQEVQTALSFLRILDNPRQDIPLAALMLSPVFAFTPEGLGIIKATYMKYTGKGRGAAKPESRGGNWGSLYKAVMYAAAREKAIGVPGVKGFVKTLKEYRAFARQSAVSEVLLRFYENTGFLAMSAAMPGGVQRRANLLALAQRAGEFEETNLRGLYPFIQYLEALEKRGADLAPAPVVGEGEDVVRIMSIHRSKGLEFPVVILATAGRRFNQSGSRGDLLLHERLGMASRVVLPEQRVKYAGAYHSLIADRIRKDMIAERQRLLYVAMTRAEQRLIVVSAGKQMTKRSLAWAEEYEGADQGGAGVKADSFMDWLGPAIMAKDEHTFWASRLWAADEIFRETERGREAKQLWRLLVSWGDPAVQDTAQGEGEWSFIGRQMEWRYPHKREGELSAKMSVTQARGRLYPETDPEAAEAAWEKGADQPELEGPRFLRGGKAVTPAERGTLLHRVLARIRPYEAMETMEEHQFTGMTDREAAKTYLEALMENLAEGQFLTDTEKDAADRDMLISFLLSGTFQRMAAADAVGCCKQEASFMMAVPAGRLYPELSPAGPGAPLDPNAQAGPGAPLDPNAQPDSGVLLGSDAQAGPGAPLGPGAQAGFDAPAGSNTAGSRQSLEESRGGTSGAVIVQGTIDAYFEEEGRLVLVDYKSDRIEPGREGDLLRRYSGQIRLYAEALEGFSGKKIGEMLLYSLPLAKAIIV